MSLEMTTQPVRVEEERRRFFEAVWHLWSLPEVSKRFARVRSADVAIEGVL